MVLNERLARAFQTRPAEIALAHLVRQLYGEGLSKAEIVRAIDQFRDDRRAEGGWTETDEDAFVDVLDALSGWTHPSAQLLPGD